MKNNDTSRGLIGLANGMRAARSGSDWRLSCTQVEMLCRIGIEPGISQEELRRQLGRGPAGTILSKSATTQAMNRVTTRPGGLGYVEVRENPTNRREHELRLTKDGEEYLANILRHLR